MPLIATLYSESVGVLPSIADNTTISPGTMITKSIKKAGNRYTSITPFFEHDDWLKIAAKLKQFGKKHE